jgi:hypothetical protein
MKTLELNRMEDIEGGALSGADCAGIFVGAAAVFAVATIATGGLMGFALGTLASMGAVPAICDNPFN